MPNTREIKTITIVSNSSELILQTLADIVPSEFAVETERYSSINWSDASANSHLASADCLIVDLMLDFQEFADKTELLRRANPNAKMIVLDDYSSLTFVRQASVLDWIDTSLNISDFPERIETELKRNGATKMNHFIGKVGEKLRSISPE